MVGRLCSSLRWVGMSADGDHHPSSARRPTDELLQAVAASADGAVDGEAASAVGVDLVHIPDFETLLDTPGTSFARRVFTVGEHSSARRRGLTGSALARHFAGRWAAKEAIIKAWSQGVMGTPPLISPEEVEWRDIDILSDSWGRLSVRLGGRVNEEMGASLSIAVPEQHLRVNISHDGDYAVAVAVLNF